MSFLNSINNLCARVAAEAATQSPEASHKAFMLEAARQQLRVHDPKARSFSIVMQHIQTNFKGI